MKQTALEWLQENLEEYGTPLQLTLDWETFDKLFKKAKQKERQQMIEMHDKGFDFALEEMENEQIGYSKEDVIKAGEMGEINHHDTEHIVSYLDEAKKYNKR